MRRLREKWDSQRGASILLALLFLLVCMMVAASVLMAAASNAGKIRSNYDEQQRYLALSSALRLVSGQIEKAEYKGAYTVQRWQVEVLDEDGNSKTPQEFINYYHVSQAPGTFTCGELTGALDLTQELDGVFSKEFSGTGYTALPVTASLPAEKPLSVKVEDDGGFTEKIPEITVKVKLDTDLRIRLTAILYTKFDVDGAPLDEGSYRMEAELSEFVLPTLDFVPGADEYAGDAPLGVTGAIQYTGPSEHWKLDWVAKEGPSP